MSTLILVTHDNHDMHPATRNIVSAALELKHPVILLVAGYQCSEVAKQAAAIAGVSSVYLADKACYQHHLAEPMADLMVHLADGLNAILAAADTFGKNILPRVAAKLNVTQVSDVSHIIDDSTFDHPIHAGNAIERVHVIDSIKIFTVHSTSFQAAKETQSVCPIESLAYEPDYDLSEFVSQETPEAVRPDLSAARVVVSGGRGLQSAEKFHLIEELADALGAAIGASRAAVDAGFVSNDCQVGQTGKVVAPALYFAIGISGAIQHVAGMKEAQVIVAINKDAQAPIFQIATYGLVGDLFELVPELITELKKLNKE